jgi:predicted enzyme related to lactoylglutathione lyase
MPTRTTTPTGAPCWVELGTSDPERSRAFYTSLFGWTVDDPGPDYGGYVNFALDGVNVAGCMRAPEGAPDGWSVYLSTPNAEKVAVNSPSVFIPPMPVMQLGTMTAVVDPGGAVIGAWQPGEFAGFGVYDEPGAPTWFELHTGDYDACVSYYRDVFEWDAHTMADEPPFRYTTYGEGDDALAGIMDAGGFPDDVVGWAVYFRATDVDATVATAVELGGSVVDQPEDTPYGRLATLADVTGARFKLRG